MFFVTTQKHLWKWKLDAYGHLDKLNTSYFDEKKEIKDKLFSKEARFFNSVVQRPNLSVPKQDHTLSTLGSCRNRRWQIYHCFYAALNV